MPTTLTPEEADRIATEHYAPVLRRMAPGYCVARVAELAELKKFYYLPRWNLGREPTDEDFLSLPLGDGGFFVSLSTGEIEEVGSGAYVYGYAYLCARDQLPEGVEPSTQELAALLARYSSDILMNMLEEVGRERGGGSP